jgi:putative DNA methylase
VTYKKKLIEVALPLDAINKASAREKSIRHGHPSTLHLWWARRPLAAARAVIFAQMVDDPSAHPDIFRTEKAQEKERQRLFRIIEDLVQWENTTNEKVLQQARDEIWQSWRYTCAENADHPRAKELFDRHKLPAFHDPFAGGGTLPLEAQRLGLEAYASDLNPVAVLICKAMIEIPPKFAGRPPVNPEARKDKSLFQKAWRGAEGLAEDVRYYGKWIRDEAEKRIGYLYPKVEITPDMAKERPDLKKYIGQKLTVIAWIWARTVKSPNPAFAHVDVPLASTFMLSTKTGKEAYVEPVIENGGYRFTVRIGKPKNPQVAKRGTKSGGSGSSFLCIISGTPMPFEYLRREGKANRIGERLMAVVAEGDRGRVYLSPTPEMERVAKSTQPQNVPETEIPEKALGFRVQEYGMLRWSDLFTQRQLVALTTFSDLVKEVRDKVKRDTSAVCELDSAGPSQDEVPTSTDAGDCITTYLALCLSKCADYWSNICIWRSDPKNLGVGHVFARQAISMTWDYAEGNPFSYSSGSWAVTLDWITRVISMNGMAFNIGHPMQCDAARGYISMDKVVSTDPPYYDNVGYADLSDFFYVWLLRTLKPIFPELFATISVPKAEELIAAPHRHGSKEKAEIFFLDGMTSALKQLANQAHPAFPVTIYYAFKQSENDGFNGSISTGWETFLNAVISAGFAVTGTWPIRTELGNRTRSLDSNALASSIVLVCQPRVPGAPSATRREFVTALKVELPLALLILQRGNIAPADLAQAAIGPGMAVYTRYAKVLDAEGKPLSVRDALALINQTLDEALAEREGDFDADTRWALAWFEQYGFTEGEYGIAEVLSKAKVTSIEGMKQDGILSSKAGKVRLLRPEELVTIWDPLKDKRLTAWEVVHRLIRAMAEAGEVATAALVAKLGSKAEVARELAYRLYTLCERKKRATEALAYNSLVQSWPEIIRLATEARKGMPRDQTSLFDKE